MAWKRTLLVVLAAATLVAPHARAAWIVDAGAGIGDPMRDFGDFWAAGTIIQVGASYLASPQFAVGLNGSFLKNDASDDYQTLLDLVDPGATDEFTFAHYGIHGKWMIPMKSATKWAPYLVAGLGLYSVKDKYESPTFTDELTQTALGMRGGAGVDYWASPQFGLGLDVNYHSAFTSEDEIGHGSAPFLAIAAGIRWKTASKP